MAGSLVPAWLRWWTIGETGCQLVYRSAWVRRLVLFAWLPILYWGISFFFIEQFVTEATHPRGAGATAAMESPPGGLDLRGQAQRFREQAQREAAQEGLSHLVQQNRAFSNLPNVEALVEALNARDRSQARHIIWSWLLMTFFRYPQSTVVVFLLGFIVPGLIARDMRSRALLLYFSRPIGRVDYMLGKLMVPAVYLLLVTVLPALSLYFWGLFLAPDLSAIWDTWDLPVRIVLAGVVVIVPTASLGLMLSSYTQESRYASFAWFAVWALGFGAWGAIFLARSANPEVMSMTGGNPLQDPVINGWAPISLFLSLGQVQSWIFGFESFRQIWPSCLSLGAVSVVSLALLFRNISRTAHGQ